MCWSVYIATSAPVQEQRWDGPSTLLTVQAIPRRESEVAGQFTKPHLYSIGAFTQCACGFDQLQNHVDDAEANASSRGSLKALGAFLSAAVTATGPVELFACWDGDQASPPEHRWRISATDIHPDMHWLPERTFVEIGP